MREITLKRRGSGRTLAPPRAARTLYGNRTIAHAEPLTDVAEQVNASFAASVRGSEHIGAACGFAANESLALRDYTHIAMNVSISFTQSAGVA